MGKDNCIECLDPRDLENGFDVSHEHNKMMKSVRLWLKHQTIEGDLVLFFTGASKYYYYETGKREAQEKDFPIDLSELEPFRCMCGSTEISTTEVDEGVYACECELCHHTWDQEDE